MNDRPDARELLEAVRRFLADEAVPALGGHLGYQARVAANVVAMVARELESESEQLEAEWRGLAELLAFAGDPPADPQALREQILEGNESLVQRIRAGDADEGPWRQAIFRHLRQTVDAKLIVARGRAGER
ncbi:MAG: DUF6285 domain-containing protein [Myxococcota bacterium]|nr:DUF6285 domain-containing protein [Myxococcota bacterium]